MDTIDVSIPWGTLAGLDKMSQLFVRQLDVYESLNSYIERLLPVATLKVVEFKANDAYIRGDYWRSLLLYLWCLQSEKVNLFYYAMCGFCLRKLYLFRTAECFLFYDKEKFVPQFLVQQVSMLNQQMYLITDEQAADFLRPILLRLEQDLSLDV